MPAVYADLIMKGIKTIDQVPEKIRDKVKKILIDRGYAEATTDTATDTVAEATTTATAE